MKLFLQAILTLLATVTLWTVSSSPIKKDGRGVLINRPTKEEIFNSRIRRSYTSEPRIKNLEMPVVLNPGMRRSRSYGYEGEPYDYQRFTTPDTFRSKAMKGLFETRLMRSAVHPESGVKGNMDPYKSRDTHINLRKGEYMCGERVCALKPGEVPQHCKDCQFRTY